MEQNSSHLKEEIARLYAIIDILISQNKTLNEEIASLKSGNASPDADTSNDNFEKGRTAVDNSYVKIETGKTGADNSYENFEKGKIDTDSSDDKIEKGRTGADTSFVKSETGINYVKSPLAKSDTGRSDALSPLPAFVEPTPAVAGKLAHLLRASGVTKVRSSTLRAMAAIIVRAHNKQDCSHSELRKLTGHSEGGIAKLLIAMKKRGLIFRDGFKRFGLSASSKEMLRQAVAS